MHPHEHPSLWHSYIWIENMTVYQTSAHLTLLIGILTDLQGPLF